MSIVFLFGNGFNYLAGDIIRNSRNGSESQAEINEKNSTADNIRDITALWRKFDEVFEELQIQFHSRGIVISHEELIRLIYTVINLFSSMPGFEKVLPEESIQKIKEAFSGFLLDKIREIALEFQDHQDNEAYKKIRLYFPTLPERVKQVIKDRDLGKIRLFTTNYDGILDTIFTNRPYGFIFSDGFNNSKIHVDLLELEPNYVESNQLVLAHLHGSYKFTKRYGTTYKIKNNPENNEPSMVFNNPDMKEEIIKADSVLSEYYRHFAKILSKYNKLVIFGNSMQTEPHIKNLIKDNFNRRGTSITICSYDEVSLDGVERQLSTCYSGSIERLSTMNITSETQLADLFDRLLTI